MDKVVQVSRVARDGGLTTFEREAMKGGGDDAPAELLTELKEHLNIRSDYQVAKLLGLTRSAVSRWRRGNSQMSDATALKIATLLDADPVWVLLRVYKSRSDSVGAQFVLQRLLNELRAKGRAILRTRRQASILLAAVAIGALTSPAPSEACSQPAPTGLYITLNRRRRDRRRQFSRPRRVFSALA